jgi:hypothetical protein
VTLPIFFYGHEVFVLQVFFRHLLPDCSIYRFRSQLDRPDLSNIVKGFPQNAVNNDG